MKYLLLLLVSFSLHAQVTVIDSQNLLGSLDTVVKNKDLNKLFPCGAISTYKGTIDELTYTCDASVCSMEMKNQLNFTQSQVAQCGPMTRTVVDSKGNYYEASDPYLKSINYNMVRHFLNVNLSLLFPENGKVYVNKVTPDVFTQFKGLPFERKMKVLAVHVAYYPEEGKAGMDLTIKYNPELMGLNQIVEYSLFEDLWSEFAF